MRLLTLFCAIAMVVAFALPAQAAVQNVKVSGDITIRSIYQNSLDLDDSDHNTVIPGITTPNTEESEGDSEGASFFMSTVGINVEADLTDNVSAVIRLVNQRDLDQTTPSPYDIGVDLAYITLKEMLYSPLTLIIGRQDIWIGDGFIIGARQLDVETSGITADELTEYTSFEAARAILDYDPWTIDLLYAKIDEGNSPIDDDRDIDLYGVNVGYVFGQYDAEAEGYWFTKYDQNPGLTADEVHTIGARGSFMPLENLDLRGELAYQFGDYNASGTSRDREAWAVNAGISYLWADYAWMPALGFEYVYLSGEEDYDTGAGDWQQFDPMYRGKTWSTIREWQEVYYQPDDTSASAGNVNEHQFVFAGSIQPTDNILLEGKYLYFLQDEDDAEGEDELGSEVDFGLTYDYTEDVSFGLLAAWFFPGDVFTSPNDDNAAEVIGTVSLVF